MKSREDLANGERKIEAFLTHLAVDEQVASAEWDDQRCESGQESERASGSDPRGGCQDHISLPESVPTLIVKLLYGSGLRIMEAVRLRIKDVDFQMKQITVRSGKGD